MRQGSSPLFTTAIASFSELAAMFAIIHKLSFLWSHPPSVIIAWRLSSICFVQLRMSTGCHSLQSSCLVSSSSWIRPWNQLVLSFREVVHSLEESWTPYSVAPLDSLRHSFQLFLPSLTEIYTLLLSLFISLFPFLFLKVIRCSK